MIAAVEAVLITATETLAEVVLVLKQVYIVAVIAVRCILVGVRILVVETPPVFSIRLTGSPAFLIPQVQGSPQHVRAVLIRLVVSTATIVPIDVRRIGPLTLALQTQAVMPEPLPIISLELVLIHSALPLKQTFPFNRDKLLGAGLPFEFCTAPLVATLLLHLLLLGDRPLSLCLIPLTLLFNLLTRLLITLLSLCLPLLLLLHLLLLEHALLFLFALLLFSNTLLLLLLLLLQHALLFLLPLLLLSDTLLLLLLQHALLLLLALLLLSLALLLWLRLWLLLLGTLLLFALLVFCLLLLLLLLPGLLRLSLLRVLRRLLGEDR